MISNHADSLTLYKTIPTMEQWSEIQAKHGDPIELRWQGSEFVVAEIAGICRAEGLGDFPQFLGRQLGYTCLGRDCIRFTREWIMQGWKRNRNIHVKQSWRHCFPVSARLKRLFYHTLHLAEKSERPCHRSKDYVLKKGLFYAYPNNASK